jgi:tetratricopeptide (TPR) repeat protein
MKAPGIIVGLLVSAVTVCAQTPQTSVVALLQLARRQVAEADPAGALDSLRRARTLAPNSEEVLSAFAQVALRAQLPLPAIGTLQALTRLCPDEAQYHYLLGVALMQVGDFAPAVESLQAADRIEPDRSLTLLALGLALTNRKLYVEARAVLTRSVAADPEHPEALAALAESEEGVGDLDSAETHARRSLARASGSATAHLVLGLVFLKQQRYAEARGALQDAIAADPSSPKAHYQLALACARLGDESCSQQHLAIYQRLLREIDERVQQLRTQTGVAPRESPR